MGTYIRLWRLIRLQWIFLVANVYPGVGHNIHQIGALAWHEDQEAFEQLFTLSGHVEWDAVLSFEHAVS